VDVEQRLELESTIGWRAWGRVRAIAEWRDGRRELLYQSNTVVKQAYMAMLSAMAGNPDEDVRWLSLGDNPAPTSWEMGLGDCALGWTSSAGQLTRAVDFANLRINFACVVDYGEANGTPAHTWYEVVLSTHAGKLYSRLAPRKPDGTIAGITKHDEYKLLIFWTIGWGVTPP
jgi:hypothetical protein